MTDNLITEDLCDFLETKEFVYLATCNTNGGPHCAPKFLIKVDGDCVFLADFVFGRTYENLRHNSKVSFSTMNLENLMGYQINGAAKNLTSGPEFDAQLKHLRKREIHFSAKRIIEGIQQGKKHESFEVAFPDQLAVIKIMVEEITHIEPSGTIKRKGKEKPAEDICGQAD